MTKPVHPKYYCDRCRIPIDDLVAGAMEFADEIGLNRPTRINCPTCSRIIAKGIASGLPECSICRGWHGREIEHPCE